MIRYSFTMGPLALIPVSILQSPQPDQLDQHPLILQDFSSTKRARFSSYEHVLDLVSTPVPQVFEQTPDQSPHSLEQEIYN